MQLPIADCGLLRLRIADCGLRIRGRILIALVLMFAGGQVRAEEPAKAVSVPFEILKSKHIAVQVMINGKGPYRLIFDTGAPFILVNTKTARDSGMLNDVKKPLFTLFNSMGAAKIKAFELGGIKLENTQAAVMDHPTVEMMSKVLGPVEGLVGFPFFARYKMTIDYSAKTMLLAPSGFSVSDADSDPNVMSRKMIEGRGDAAKVLAPAAQWGFLPQKEKGDETDGVDVKEVFPGSAAAAAGLRAGDRLLTLDSRWTDSVPDAYFAAKHVKAGTSVKLLIRRDGKEMTLTVTPRAGL